MQYLKSWLKPMKSVKYEARARDSSLTCLVCRQSRADKNVTLLSSGMAEKPWHSGENSPGCRYSFSFCEASGIQLSAFQPACRPDLGSSMLPSWIWLWWGCPTSFRWKYWKTSKENGEDETGWLWGMFRQQAFNSSMGGTNQVARSLY